MGIRVLRSLTSRHFSLLTAAALTAGATLLLSQSACSDSSGDSTSGGAAGDGAGAGTGLGGASATPTRSEMVRGDGQSAVVGTAVAIDPTVRVLTTDGEPVSGFTVRFLVIEGDGSVEGAETTTGSNGEASVGDWILGPIPGRNRLRAEMPGLPPVDFTATGTPSAAGSFTIAEGNGQTATIGTSVPNDLVVVLTTQDGTPRANVEVTITVTGGGGTIRVNPGDTPTTTATATTNADGEVRIDEWVLGSTAGENTLRVEVDGLPPLTFTATAVSNETPLLTVTEVQGSFNNPWDLGFSPDGSVLFFTEKAGRIRAVAGINGGSPEVRTLIDISDEVNDSSQSGMMGLAVHPDFPTTPYIYTYHTVGSANRIVRWTVNGSVTSVGSPFIVADGITWGEGGAHSGGALEVGPDGKLWLGTGDVRTGPVPQNLQSLGGKILKYEPAGGPAAGNPSIPGALPAIFAYGFRNVQGLAFQPVTNRPYACEHGPGHSDEVTPLEPGGNGGWDPNDDGAYTGYAPGEVMTDTSLPNVLMPAWVFNGDERGMSGCTFVRGTKWKAWDGRLAISFLAGERVDFVQLNGAGDQVVDTDTGVSGRGRMRAAVLAPNGDLFVTGGNAILRVTPE